MNQTILVVEDDDMLREFLCEALQLLGYEILQADCAAAALSIWKRYQNSIDLLLTDVDMPGGWNGVELAKKLQNAQPELKVIFSTGHDVQQLIQDYSLSETSHVLQKPFRMDDLDKVISRALDRAEEVEAYGDFELSVCAGAA